MARLCFSTTYVCVDRPISRVFFRSLFPICSRSVPNFSDFTWEKRPGRVFEDGGCALIA